MPKEVYVDLDSLLEDKVSFQFKGAKYTFKQIDAQTFMKCTNEVNHILSMLKEKSVHQDEVLARYTSLVQAMCDGVDLAMIASMTQSQIAALLQVCFDYIRGRVGENEEVEKKTLPLMESQSLM